MNLLILFNQDWSAELVIQKANDPWTKNKSISSADLDATNQSRLASKIELFRGQNEPWTAKQVNAREVFLPVEVEAISEDLTMLPEPTRAIELTAYVFNPDTGETRWITAKDMPEFILTDQESLDFWDSLNNFLNN